MDKAQLWRQAQHIFDQAIDLPEEQRMDHVRSQCGDSDELLSLVKELLDADQPTSEHNDNTLAVAVIDALDDLETDKYLSLELDNYRLIRKIGQGGMGTVFHAERSDDSFHKKVAIKIMRAGFGSDDRERRFVTERQILADLEHPQIARLLDGGTTVDGQPYVVMEYVDGVNIISYADYDKLSIPQRLALFRECCAVVQHAHDHLIVHRDIKPSNLLIDRSGNLKLLDFGIAKMLEVGTDQDQTQHYSRLLTPSYASPEQVLGKPITTTSDVYSLGVLLYELLAGVKPYNYQSLTPGQFENILLNEIPKPLHRWFDPDAEVDLAEFNPEAIAEARGTTPGQLRKTLHGDLNSIVFKAMTSEPQKRYNSAQALSDDIQRYLEQRPVQARPASLAYRTGKLVRRRTAAVVAAAAAVIMVVVFVTMTILQAQRLAVERDAAIEQQQRAESVTNFLVDTYEAFDPASTPGEQITARQILEAGVKRLDEHLKPELQIDLLMTMGKVYGYLGLYSDAEDLLQRALDIHITIPEANTEVHSQLLYLIARSQLDNAQFQNAIDTIEESMQMRDPELPDAILHQASALMVLARANTNLDHLDEAQQQYELALDLFRETTGEQSQEVATAMSALAGVLEEQGADLEADRLFQQALSMMRQHHPGDHPSIADILLSLANVNRELKRLDMAESYAADSIDMLERIYDQPHPDLAVVLNTMGRIQKDLKNYSAAADYFIRSLEIKRDVLGDDHPRVAMSLFNLAYLKYRNLDDLNGAEQDFRKSLEIAVDTWEPDHTIVYQFRASLGFVLNDKDQLDEAESIFRDCLDILSRKQPAERFLADTAKINSVLANVLIKKGQFDEARALLDSSVPVLIEEYGLDDQDTQRALAWQGLIRPSDIAE